MKPIDRLAVTVETGNPDILPATCFAPLAFRTGNIYDWSATRFTPSGDIDLKFMSRGAP